MGLILTGANNFIINNTSPPLSTKASNKPKTTHEKMLNNTNISSLTFLYNWALNYYFYFNNIYPPIFNSNLTLIPSIINNSLKNIQFKKRKDF